MSITNKQKTVINFMNKNLSCFAGLTECDYEFSRCDALSDGYRVEVKTRSGGPKAYPDGTMIEKDKAGTNILKCKENQQFIYAVLVGNKLYLWNVSQLREEKYNFNWEDRFCNKTTLVTDSYGQKGRKVEKQVGYLGWDDASAVFDIKKNEWIK